jgi:hypothetical protein
MPLSPSAKLLLTPPTGSERGEGARGVKCFIEQTLDVGVLDEGRVTCRAHRPNVCGPAVSRGGKRGMR